MKHILENNILKTRLLPVSSAVLVMMLAASCSNDIITDGEIQSLPENTYPLSFQATVSGRVDSRAGGKDSWIADDKIGVQLYDKTATYKYSAEKSSFIPDATPLYWESTAPATVKAWYPSENKEYVLTDQTEGFASLDFMKAEKLMSYSSTQEESTLSFSHLMSKVECTLTTDGSITIADVQFIGTPEVIFNNGNLAPKYVNLSGISPEETSEVDIKKYTALLYPQQMKGKSFIVVTDNSGTQYTYKSMSEEETNLKAGYIHSFEIEVLKGEVNISSTTVTNWNEEEESTDATLKTSFKVVLPEGFNTEDGYTYKSLKEGESDIEVTNNTFDAPVEGFSISFTPSADQLDKGFLVQKGIAQVMRTTSIDEAVTYTYKVTNLKRDITLSFGEYIQIGDYYFSDNTTAGLSTKEGAQCIGIVFHLGAGPGDNKDNYAGTAIAQNGIRGYVVALNDAHKDAGIWGPRTQVNGIESLTSYSNSYLGYKNSQIVKAAQAYTDADISDPDKANTHWAFKAAIEYSESVPEATSGWYLPSIGQLYDISQVESINELCTSASGMAFRTDLQTNDYGAKGGYWSSTEFFKGPEQGDAYSDAYYFMFDSNQIRTWSKSQDFAAPSYVRSVLTF